MDMFTNLMLIIGPLIRQIDKSMAAVHTYFMLKYGINKMFQFIEKAFFLGLAILSSFTNASSLSWISTINQECKTRP